MRIKPVAAVLVAALSLPALASAAASKPVKPAVGVSTPTAPGTPPPHIPVSTRTALTVDEVLAHYEDFDKRLQSLVGRFKQTVSFEESGVAQTAEGTLEYAKPDKLRIEHFKPGRQTIVAEGDTLWIHRLASNQVIETSLQDWKKADPVLDNLVDFGNYAAMLKSYDVSLSTNPAPTLILRPKAKAGGADFSLRLALSPGDLFPREADLRVGQMHIKTAFEEVRLNPGLSDDRFKFTPPAGADVFMNFKPPRLAK